MADRGGDDERAEHDKEREDQQRHRSNQHVADRLEPQPPPVAHLGHIVGAIEADAHAFDGAGGEVDGERDADGEHIAARGGEHVADFAGERAGDLLRPGLQQDARDLVGELLGAGISRRARSRK